MGLGFFAADAPGGRVQVPLLARCGECGLHRLCKSPKMPVAGEGRRKILVVGEAPGETEDEQGKPFIGKAGQLLQRSLSDLQVDLFQDCWVTNSAICRPKDNELPEKAIDHCRPNIVKAISELRPRTIILLGKSAVRSVIGWQWKPGVGEMGKWVGWQIPCQKLNAWICPTWHPSYLARQEGSRDYPVLELWFKRHLKAAFKLEGRPWKEPPDYAGKVRVEMDPSKAAGALRVFIAFNKPLAFDFETDRLKPDHPDARIISCAVSDGDTSLAFPWVGEAVTEMQVLLKSAVPKIGWNIKFEERWCRRLFGHGVKNWVWDGMLAAHVLDNRTGITGLDFQAWVQLGQPEWDRDTEVRNYKKSDNSNAPNRLRECPLPMLLKYNGLDALLEWELAQRQAKQLGVKL